MFKKYNKNRIIRNFIFYMDYFYNLKIMLKIQLYQNQPNRIYLIDNYISNE